MIGTKGIVRSADELGRVVVPIEARRALNFTERQPLEIFVEDNKIILRKYQPGCLMCGSMDYLMPIKEKHICRECVEFIKKQV